MNWLAHLLLSEPTAEFRLGGLLPDFTSPPALAHLPAEFQKGVKRHHQIDACTDAHPVFRRSVQRFDPPLRRFGGVLTDIFYDHFVTRQWESLSHKPLDELLSEVYASIDRHRSELPVDAYMRLISVRARNYLGSYGSMEGLTHTLRRLSRRFRRPVDLVPAVAMFERQYEDFQADFADFFPVLCSQVLPPGTKVALKTVAA